MNNYKHLLITSSLIFILAVIQAGILNSFKVEASQKSQKNRTSTHTKKQSPEQSQEEIAKRRNEIHELIMSGKYQHDGALELDDIGDINSVPVLLKILKDNPPTELPDGRSLEICTVSHAKSALIKITGNKTTRTYNEWNEWWEQYQKEHHQK